MIHPPNSTKPSAPPGILSAGKFLFLVMPWLSLCLQNLALAETEIPNDRSDEYISVRGSIYSKTLANFKEQGYRAYFKLRLSTSVYKYRSLDELFFDDVEHFNSIGLRPTLTFAFPTAWQNIQFEPTIDIQATHRFDLEQSLLSGSASTVLRYRDEKKTENLKHIQNYNTELDMIMMD